MDTISVKDAGSVRIWLWAHGYRPVPISNPSPEDGTAGKRPVGAGWQIAARSSPPRCVSAPVDPRATNTGILTDGLRAIDIDVDDEAKAAEVEALARELLGFAPVRGRDNSGKRLLVYRAAEGEPVKRAITGSDGKVEVLGRGQQFVAFGVHPSGAHYEWRDDLPALKELVALTEDDITAFLDAARDMIGAQPAEVPDTRPKSVERGAAPENIGARERAAFETALDAECQIVRTAGAGTRNDTLNRAAFNLGTAVGAGWGTRGEAEASLTDAGLAAGLTPTEVRKTIRSGLDNGIANPRGALSNRDDDRPIMDMTPLLRGKTMEVIDGTIFDPETGEVVGNDDDDLDEDDDEDAPPSFPLELTHVDGALGDLTDWIAACSSTGNRVLALAAALPVCGTLLGRRMATPTLHGGMLELYIIATMESGAGKSDGKRAINRIFETLKLDTQHLAPTGFRSGAAFVSHLCAKPLSISVMDEIADEFQNILSGKQHMLDLESELKGAFGTNFASYRGKESLTRGGQAVHAPCFSIYGMTTAENLFRVVKSKDVTSGFINRFMVIDGGEKTKQTAVADVRNPPRALVDKLKALYFMGRKTGELSDHMSKNMDHDPDPVVVPWATKAAELAWEAFDEECNAMQKEYGPELGKLYARTSFMAIKMATIRAASARRSITVDDVQWGAAIAKLSADKFRMNLKDSMVDPISYPELFQKIKKQFTAPTTKGLKLMERYGDMVLPKRFLWENLKHHTGKTPYDFQNCIKVMIDSGEIAALKVKAIGAKDGVDCLRYRAARRKKSPQ